MSEDNECGKSEDYWKKCYATAEETIRKFLKQIEELQQRCTLLEMEKKQWETEKLIQQAIIQQALNKSNATSNEYLEENNKLKAELEKIRG